MQRLRTYLIGSGCLWEACAQQLQKKLAKHPIVEIVALRDDLSPGAGVIEVSASRNGKDNVRALAITELLEEEYELLKSERIPPRFRRWFQVLPEMKIVAIQDEIVCVVRLTSTEFSCGSVQELVEIVELLAKDVAES